MDLELKPLWSWIKDRFQSLNRIQTIIALLVIAVVITFLSFTLYREWDVIVAYDWTFNLVPFLIFIGAHSLALGTMFASWYLIVNRLTGRNDIKSDLSIYSLSILARRIPLPIWYVGSRLVLYKQKGVSIRASSGATILETLFISLAGAICYILLLPWYSYTSEWTVWPVLIFLVIGIVVIIIRPKSIGGAINGLIKLFKRQPLDFQLTRKDITVWTIIYLGTWFIDGLGLYFLSATIIPNQLPIIDVIGISTITALVAILSMILPSGLGIKEITMGALFSMWIPLSAGLIVSIVYRIAQTIVELIWALLGQKISLRSQNIA